MSSVPLIVKKYIDRHSVLTRPALATPQKNSARVEVAILHDELGKLQVFFAADTILDLGKIRQKLGREMKAISGKELKTILDKNGLASIPAFDMLLNMETIVDSRLLDYEKLTLYSGNLDEYFQVNDPKKLIQMASSKIEDICTELPDTNLNYENFYERDQHAINQSLSSFTILRIQKRLEETLELPPLPETARAIIELRSDPDADVDKLGKIVERDPSLAAQVVSWASSSYYSAPGNIKSIQDAIIRVLGYDLVMNLALGLSLGKTLTMPGDNPEGYASYWQEAVYSAATQGALINLIPRELRPSFGLAYLNGLLHNFGYLILAHAFPPHFKGFCRLQEVNKHLKPQQIEQNILGISRDQIGSALMRAWNLPDEVIYGMRYQNAPLYNGVHFDYAKLNYVSLALLKNYGVISGAKEEIDDQLFEGLHIDRDLIPELMEKLIESKSELDTIVSNLSA